MNEPRNRLRPDILGWLLTLGGIALSFALILSRAQADEIRFKTGGGVQTGIVLEEGEGTVTLRFPREAIESITRTGGKPEEERKPGPVPSLEERVRKLETELDSLSVADSPKPGREGAGGVEGVIHWKNRPLSHGKVMIVRARTAGVSPPVTDMGRAGGVERGDRYETETDEGGRYRFERVSPGEYLVYWMPDGKTGWVRRLREKPDLDVVRGSVTVLNIPAEKK